MKSMTGYSSRSFEQETFTLFWEIKSLNYKYLELRVRVPAPLEQFENLIRRLVKQEVSRGKLDVTLTLVAKEQMELDLLRAQVNKYSRLVRTVSEESGIDFQVSLSELLSLQSLLNAPQEGIVLPLTEDDVAAMCRSVLADFQESRTVEGEMTGREISGFIRTMQGLLNEVEKAAPRLAQTYRQTLEQRIRDLISDKVDESRIMTEVGIYATKIDVSEEIARVRSHLEKMSGVLGSDGPCGRELDFITQEVLREINTIGSKIPDYFVSEKAVGLKVELDKIKEQVRNVE
jgi:uncharacterized protein (TIGR00255 family)